MANHLFESFKQMKWKGLAVLLLRQRKVPSRWKLFYRFTGNILRITMYQKLKFIFIPNPDKIWWSEMSEKHKLKKVWPKEHMHCHLFVALWTRVVMIRQNLYHDNRSLKYHDNWIITILELFCKRLPKPNFWSTNLTSVRNCQGQFQVCNVVPFKTAQIVGIYLIFIKTVLRMMKYS